ncbi:homoaconitase [candidate division KSB1 bacterium]|nr:homoaconitase [candidate division KSB1 bacterium]
MQNLVEKIAQKYAVDLEPGQEVHSEEYIFIRPAHVMTHDNTGAVIGKFRSTGAVKMADPRQPVFTLDHNIQDKTDKNLEKYRNIENFAAEMGVDFYPAGRGIGHQIMCEEGYAFPGTMLVASDSHSNMYGGLGCLGTPVVRTDAAAIWATGQTWWRIPPVAKVELKGKLRPGVSGKDVIVTLCGLFNNDEVLNHAVEFTGEGVSSLNIDQRLTIANMTTEWGALAGIFPVDELLIDWLRKRAVYLEKRKRQGVPSDKDVESGNPRLNKDTIRNFVEDSIKPDGDAFYSKLLELDLSSVRPFVSGPDHVKVMTSVSEIEKQNIKIHKAYLLSCVNSRVDDIAQAAEVVRGKKVSNDVEFYIAAASSEVEEESKKRGDWQTLIDSGAIPLPPGCGPCIGLGTGLLKDGEVGISATNRNFKGRMGSREARSYLASPAVVAASAVAGKIAGPKDLGTAKPIMSFRTNARQDEEIPTITLLDGMPAELEGELIFCHQDNLNTDGIYPGKYTYVDDITPEQQADVVMENYDPDFGNLVKKGDILVGGENFGTGSSREQAATSLKYRGIQLVIAASISETYKRNALNNGFLTIEAPQLVSDLKSRFGVEKLTIRTGLHAVINFSIAMVHVDGVDYPIGPVGPTAQQLLIDGGLESWIKKRLKN